VTGVGERIDDRASPVRIAVTTVVDLRVDQLVGARTNLHELRPRTEAERSPLRGRQQAERTHPELEHLGQGDPQPVQTLARTQSEDRGKDHLHGQGLHPGVHRHALAARPGCQLVPGDPGDRVFEPLHALAVKGGEDQLLLAHVRAFVQQQDRVGSNDRLEDPGTFSRVEHVGRGREDLFDLFRIRDHHERILRHQADREPAAVDPAATLEEAGRPGPPAGGLERPREARAGGQLA